MKTAIRISLFLLLINTSSISGYQCPLTLLSSPAAFSYNTPPDFRTFQDPTAINMPNGQTSLTISFDIKVISLWSQPAPQHLVVVTVGTKSFMDFIIDTDNTPTINTQTTGGTTELITYLNTPFPMDVWITMAATLDTAAETFSGAIFTPNMVDAGHSNTPITGMVTPDSAIKFSFCSDVDGTYPIECQLANFKVIYTTYPDLSLYNLALGTEPILIRRYRFKENTGYATNSVIPPPSKAYFGASTDSFSDTSPTTSPSWAASDKALSFTQTTQYLNIPSFSLSPCNQRANTASLSVHFWFQATATPSVGGDTLFRIASADLTSTRIAITIDSALTLQVTVGDSTVSAPTVATFTLNTWTQVIANIIILDETTPSHAFVSVNFGSTTVIEVRADSAILSSDFQGTDAVHVGGFIGEIADLRIYSPGAYYMSTTPCTSGCPFDLGATKPATCFQPDCGSGSFASSCIDCDASCTSCSATSICRSCPVGSILYGSSCNVCPTYISCQGSIAIPIGGDGGGGGGGSSGNGNGNGATTNTETKTETTTTSTNAGGRVGIAIGATLGALLLLGVGYFAIKKIMRKRRVNVFRISQDSQINSSRTDANQTVSIDTRRMDQTMQVVDA